MLLLTRIKDQEIVIPALGITIKIVGTCDRKDQANRAFIGIDAPREIPVRRAEIEPNKPNPSELSG